MLVLPLENVRNHSGAGLLAGLVQVGVDVGGGGEVRVAQEVGHVNQRHVLVDEQAGESVPKLVEAENGRRSWNRQIRISYINDKKAVEISPQPFLYLALIFIAVNLSARYSIC